MIMGSNVGLRRYAAFFVMNLKTNDFYKFATFVNYPRVLEINIG